jgi:5'-nucleotidase
MTRPISDLSKARILVTNDDGVQAKGIRILYELAKTLTDDVWVVAPELEQSGAGHSLTLRRPLRLKRYDEQIYGVDGTPTDAVLMAVGHVMREHRPDLVLSGINRGGNLGEDVTYSGTVSAAMEGTLLNVPSIALSLNVGGGQRGQWATAERFVPDLVRKLTATGWSTGVLINVNIPNIPADDVQGVDVVALGRRKLGDQLEKRLDPRGYPYYWIGPMREEAPDQPDTDLAAILAGRISVTPIHLDLTQRDEIPRLQTALE